VIGGHRSDSRDLKNPSRSGRLRACSIAFDLRLQLDGFWSGDHMRFVWAVALCALVAGCATKYQDMGFTGGVAAEQITADTWRIRARGNAYKGNSTVQDYVLLKAAETAQASGATHFQIISEADASRASTIVVPGSSTTTVVGHQAFTTTSPGSVDTVIKPGQDVYVRILRLPPGPTPQGVYSATEIIQFVGSRVQRPG